MERRWNNYFVAITSSEIFSYCYAIWIVVAMSTSPPRFLYFDTRHNSLYYRTEDMPPHWDSRGRGLALAHAHRYTIIQVFHILYRKNKPHLRLSPEAPLRIRHILRCQNSSMNDSCSSSCPRPLPTDGLHLLLPQRMFS